MLGYVSEHFPFYGCVYLSPYLVKQITILFMTCFFFRLGYKAISFRPYNNNINICNANIFFICHIILHKLRLLNYCPLYNLNQTYIPNIKYIF